MWAKHSIGYIIVSEELKDVFNVQLLKPISLFDAHFYFHFPVSVLWEETIGSNTNCTLCFLSKSNKWEIERKEHMGQR